MKNGLQREMLELRQLFLGLCTSAEPNHSLSTLSGSRSSHKKKGGNGLQCHQSSPGLV